MWINLKDVLGEIIQPQKDKYPVIPLNMGSLSVVQITETEKTAVSKGLGEREWGVSV